MNSSRKGGRKKVFIQKWINDELLKRRKRKDKSEWKSFRFVRNEKNVLFISMGERRRNSGRILNLTFHFRPFIFKLSKLIREA